MPVYKNEEKGTWFCAFYYTDWMGNHKKKKKEGIRTLREAKAYERLGLENIETTLQTYSHLYPNKQINNLVIASITSSCLDIDHYKFIRESDDAIHLFISLRCVLLNFIMIRSGDLKYYYEPIQISTCTVRNQLQM